MSLQRRQREHQKGKRLRWAKQQLCPSYFFVHFFAVTARLRREMPNFMSIDIVNIRRRIFFLNLDTLRNSAQESSPN